ncbi:hypothetical protein [Croceimicrobium sp.]|uniref:hypothetical protein n=1 Tax=Croceimicrobium sp. TaxID=2828340 RepID=UPI003BA886AC
MKKSVLVVFAFVVISCNNDKDSKLDYLNFPSAPCVDLWFKVPDSLFIEIKDSLKKPTYFCGDGPVPVSEISRGFISHLLDSPILPQSDSEIYKGLGLYTLLVRVNKNVLRDQIDHNANRIASSEDYAFENSETEVMGLPAKRIVAEFIPTSTTTAKLNHLIYYTCFDYKDFIVEVKYEVMCDDCKKLKHENVYNTILKSFSNGRS